MDEHPDVFSRLGTMDELGVERHGSPAQCTAAYFGQGIHAEIRIEFFGKAFKPPERTAFVGDGVIFNGDPDAPAERLDGQNDQDAGCADEYGRYHQKYRVLCGSSF